MENVLHAVVVKNSNQAVLLVSDPGLLDWFQKIMPLLDVIPIVNTGTSSRRTQNGTINAVSLYTEDHDIVYYMIQQYPDNLTLAEAYDLMSEK